MNRDITAAWQGSVVAAVLSQAVSAAATELPGRPTEYPARPIRLLIGLPAGGSADIIARIVGARLGETLGWHIVVDNRPGGSGLIAPQLAARAVADGYTLLFRASFFSELVASVVRRMPYDLLADFAAVSLVIKVPNVLVVNPQMPVRTVAELIAHAKANPGKLNYASSGPGSSAHLAMEALKKQTGMNLVHVPYSGAPQAIGALLGGEVQVMFGNAPAQIPQARTGKLRALAVTSAARNPQLPNVPTMEEAGIRDFELTVWFGVVAPAGVAQPILSKLNSALVKTLMLPDVREALAKQGGEASPTTRQEFAAFQKAEVKRWSTVAKDSGASFE